MKIYIVLFNGFDYLNFKYVEMDKSNRIYLIRKVIIIVLLLVIVSLLVFIIIDRSCNNSNKSLSDKTEISNVKDDVSRTIMIYVAGSNLESESAIVSNELASIDPSKVDLNNVKVLLYTGGTLKWHNFISNNENAIYELKSGGFEKVKTFNKNNMGDSLTLLEFMNYSYDNYKTDAYDLMFYDHGGAVDGAIYDDFTNDHLELLDFKDALAKSPFNEKNKLELVIFRTCLNGTLEVANAFKSYADYMVSSEEITYGSSEYSVLDFLHYIGRKDNSIEVGKKFIESYKKQTEDIFMFEDLPTITYSIIDLNKIDSVNENLNKYFLNFELIDNFNNITKTRSQLYQYAYDLANDGGYDTIDLYEFVSELNDINPKYGKELLDSINDAIVYNESTYKEDHGLAIYFPYRGSSYIKGNFLSVMENIDDMNEYYKFINNYNNYRSNNSSKSFSGKMNNSSLSNNEFSIKLSDSQVKDFASAAYFIFKKNPDGTYMPIYLSDKTELSNNGVLKTKIENNLIQITDELNETNYLTTIETVKGKVVQGLVYDYSGSDYLISNVSINIIENDNNVKLGTIVNTTSDKNHSFSGAIINEKDVDLYQFPLYHWKIEDDSGLYTENHQFSETKYLVEVKPNNFKLNKVSIKDSDDLYCVFKIFDVYGNYRYSNLVQIS